MYSYRGYLVEQQPATAVRFVVFVARAKEIAQWAQADNIKLDKGNVQRELVEARWRQIKKFYRASPNNVIPTSVTIALDEALPSLSLQDLEAGAVGYNVSNAECGLHQVTLSDGIRESAFIIDGQHRLKGMSELEEDIVVPVSLLLSLSKLERAFQFITINNKAHKVPTDNLKALIANFEAIQSDLRARLTTASIVTPRFATFVDVLNEDPESPFHKMVDWVNNRFADANALVPPSALENALKAINRAFPETRDDPSDALAILYAVWREVFSAYGVRHDNAEEFPNLMLKATIQTVSEMIVDKLKADYDPAFAQGPVMGDNGYEAGQKARDLVRGIPPEFWRDRWTLRSLDTSAGREIIENDIRLLKRVRHLAAGADIDWKSRLTLYGGGGDDDVDY